MSLRRAVALLATALASLPAVSHAKVGFQAQLSLSTGWTDNILGQAVGLSDFYAEVQPALILSHAAARAVQTLSYNFDATLYFTHSDANAYSQRLQWNCFFFTSKRTDLRLSASVGQGRRNAIALQGSDLTTVSVSPATPFTFVNGSLSEQFGWDINPRWRFVQALALNGTIPIEPANTPRTIDLDQRLRIDRYFPRDSLGLEFHELLSTFSEVRGPVPIDSGVDPDGVVTPQQQVLVNELTLNWRHDYGRYFTHELGLGVVEANCVECAPPIQSPSTPVVQPSALAALHFVHDYGNADLSYTHTVRSNAAIASTFLVDSVELRANLPLGRKSGVRLSASGGYQFARQIDFSTGGGTLSTLSTTHVAVADATLSYNPVKRPEIGIFARYSYFQQFGNPEDAIPQSSITRNVVLIGITGIYPLEAAATVPRGQGVRADRSDQPTITAPHSEPVKK